LDAKLVIFIKSFIRPFYGRSFQKDMIIMKTFFASHRALVVLATLGGYAITTMAHRPTLAEPPPGWLIGVLALFALGLVLAVGLVLTMSEPWGLHHALGGLLILTGIIVFTL